MQPLHTKVTLIVGWVLAMCLAGFAANVTSVPGWIVLMSLTFLPPIFILRLWNDPPQTMSETIQQARR